MAIHLMAKKAEYLFLFCFYKEGILYKTQKSIYISVSPNNIYQILVFTNDFASRSLLDSIIYLFYHI